MPARAQEKFTNKYGARGLNDRQKMVQAKQEERLRKAGIRPMKPEPTGVLRRIITVNQDYADATTLLGHMKEVIYLHSLSSTTIANMTNNDIWDGWANTASTITLNGWTDIETMHCNWHRTKQDIIYEAWATGAVSQPGQLAPFVAGAPARIHTEAEWERIRQNQLENERRYRLEAERKAVNAQAALTRANKLLRAFLTAEQIKTLQEHNYIDVRSQFGRIYRIEVGTHGNVFLLKNGKKHLNLCAQPDQAMPAGDVMLAQMFMLQNDELKYVNTANASLMGTSGGPITKQRALAIIEAANENPADLRQTA